MKKAREEESRARAGKLAAPLHVRPAAGAGDHHREEPPPQRARWSDVLRYLWMCARGFARGVGRVLFLLRRQSSAAAAGVVVAKERSGRPEGNGGQLKYAFMYSKLPKARRNDELAHHDDPATQQRRSDEPGHHDDPAWQVSDTATAAGSAPTQAPPLERRSDKPEHHDDPESQDLNNATAAGSVPTLALPLERRSDEPKHHDDPESQDLNNATAAGSDPTLALPLMVGDECVWGEELRLFASYCQRSLTCGKRILCHRCIFEQHKYCGTDTILLSHMPLHSFEVHQGPGLQCETCKVQVGTPRELRLHAHFCHTLETGWWNQKDFKKKIQVVKTD